MSLYRIHRLKETQRDSFRWAAHTGGLAVVKAKDYEQSAEQVEAATPYAAWKMLTAENRGLHPGDLLEIVTAEPNADHLHIFKYIGFEPAKWYVPEPAPATSSNAAEIAPSAISSTSVHSV